MIRGLTALTAGALLAAPALAQTARPQPIGAYSGGAALPYAGPTNYGSGVGPGFQGTAVPYGPNAYARQRQPLSPYLNLVGLGNPAVNYFYNVRPGLPTNNPTFSPSPAPFGYSQLRAGYLPPPAPEGSESVEPAKGYSPVERIPSAGRPVTFGNKFGPTSGGLPGAFGPSQSGGTSGRAFGNPNLPSYQKPASK